MISKLVIKFIIINIIFVSILFTLAFRYHNYKKSQNKQKRDSFKKWVNQGEITFRSVLVGLSFGFIFGFIDNFFLWIGTDFLERYIPGDAMTKAGWGNTYSDFIGATFGTAFASIFKNFLGYNDDNPLTTPIWLDAIAIPIGCIAGLYVGKVIIGNKTFKL